MSGHTKGPWERVDTADYAEIHPQGQRQKSAIALVASPGDADLISAAPDLLEALEEVMEWISNWGTPFLEDEEWGGTYDKVTAAIAKAEGRS